MDTKSIKTHNNRVLKVLIIFLSCVLLYSSTYFGEKLLSFASQSNTGAYGVIDVLKRNDTSSVLGNGSTQFAQEVLADNGRIITLATRYVSDEAVENGSSFAPIEQGVRNSYKGQVEDAIKEAKLDKIDSMYVYNENKERYEYPYATINQSLILQDFSSDDQINADSRSNSSRGITVIDGNEYYKGYPLKYVTVDEDSIKASYEADLQRRIISEKASFETGYKELKEHVGKLKNYSYYIVNTETGNVYTNMDVSNILNAAKNMSDYSVSLIDGSLKVSTEISDMVESVGYTSPVLNSIYYYSEDVSEYENTYDLFNAVFTSTLDANKYNIYIHVNTTESTLVEGDEYNTFFQDFEKQTQTLRSDLIFCILSMLCWLASLVYLAINAGMMTEDGIIKMSPIDNIPNSIHLVLSLGFFMTLAFLVPFGVYFDYLETVEHNIDITTVRVLTSLSALFANLFLVEWLMSVSRHLKTSTFWKNSIINRLIIENVKKIEKWSEASKVGDSYFNFKLRVAIPAFFSMLTLIPVSIWTAFLYYWGKEIVAIPLTIVLVGYVILFLRYIVRLANGLENIANALASAENGEYKFKVETESSPNVIRVLGEMTNNLTEGMKVAVDETVKGERMKAELITNVSHDLKTPLTSIINYTNLLKQCDIQDEAAKGYIDVLDEKSNRLKKLIEDLVETSKANSGNMKLDLMELNVTELVGQIYGEYEDLLQEVNLDLRYDVPDEPLMIVADGEKTYRIIENLFSNVKKYAMPGTRVYLNVSKESQFAAISMKNVSKDEMHFDTEMLAERFVRGDCARSTEGSGLGLSIAKSITELEGGEFEVSVDGDLFCVTIKLPLKK